MSARDTGRLVPKDPRPDTVHFGEDDRARLAAWFADHARDLPWRHDRTPYRVWVAEIMLQQTRAAAVAPYYERWMRRFPTVASVAEADLQEVLALWEGLGYYRRARSLHAAARTIAIDRGGRWPASEEAWRALPGVGAYTAAAIAAHTLENRTVAIDGNVRRVGARLAADEAPSERALHDLLLPLIDPARPGRGCEALIELGATVCTPHGPDCGACPLAASCRGRRTDPSAYPRRRARRAAPRRRRYAPVHLDGERVWLERRPTQGLLGGLWGLPQCDEAPAGRALAPLQQVYSHFRLELVPVLVDGPPAQVPGEAGWMDAAARAALPLSAVDRALLADLRREGLLGSGT